MPPPAPPHLLLESIGGWGREGLSNDYGCAVVVTSYIENLCQLITIIPVNNFLFQPTTTYPTTLTGHDVIIISPRFVGIDYPSHFEN